MYNFHAHSLLAFCIFPIKIKHVHMLYVKCIFPCCHKHTCNNQGIIIVSTLLLAIGNRTFLIVNNGSLMKLAQMYEFIAEGP